MINSQIGRSYGRIKFAVTISTLILCFATPFVAGVMKAEDKGNVEHAASESGKERSLTPQELRGKMIYESGESLTGEEIKVTIGEVEVPPSTVTCAGCHGLRGEGKTEAGISAGSLTWSHLTRPEGHRHPSGRRHGPFDEDSFARSVVEGFDPDDNELLIAMPRFRMSKTDMQDLISYLKRIESKVEKGVSEKSVKVCTLLFSKGPLAEMSFAMRDVLTAYFDDANGRGGVNDRKIELHAVETGETPSSTAANVRRALTEEDCFAFVGGITAGADKELFELAKEFKSPFIGPSTLSPQTSNSNSHVFYILPGLPEQARALVNFAVGSLTLKNARTAIVYSDAVLSVETSMALEDQARKAGVESYSKLRYERATFDARQLVEKLKNEKTEAVFFLGARGEESAFVKEAAAVAWTPHIFLIGALLGKDLFQSVPVNFKGRVYLAFPTIPSDTSPKGIAEFRALLEKYKFAQRNTASQNAALASAKIFVEGLRRAGRDLSREKLVEALEVFNNFDTGFTPRITFGPNRRVGAAGAYILTFDPLRKEFVNAGGWINAF